MSTISKPFLSYKLLVILAFAAIYFIWGTTFLAIIIGLEGFPPFLLASLRFLIAGFLLVGYCLYKGEKIPSKASILKNTVLGLIVLTGGQGLLIWAEQYITSGYAAILVATLPLWYVIIDKKNWKIYFSNPYIIGGVALGFGGILILFNDTLGESFNSELAKLQLVASLAVLIGAVCWVVGTLYHRSNGASGSSYSNLGWQLLSAAVICFLISLSLGELSSVNFASVSWRAWSALAYLSIAGSIVAFVSYTWLLTQKPSAVVGTYAYINPVVAVSLGWFLAGEVITANQFLGMIVILGSAILVNITRSKI